MVATGCRTQPVYRTFLDGKYEAVVACGGTDDQTQQAIRSIFNEHNIRSADMGDLIYDFYVPLGKGSEAKQFLKKDARLKGRWVKYY